VLCVLLVVLVRVGLVLNIFLAILPILLDLMARYEGKISLSQVDFSVGEWC
jgi:hypothetical protein